MNKLCKIKILLIIGVMFSFQSCRKDLDKSNNIPNESIHFVSIDKVYEIVQNNQKLKGQLELFSNEAARNSIDSINILEYTEIKDSDDITVFYLTKLSNNIVLTFAADNRSHPILSYSDFKNGINLDSIPKSFLYWLYGEVKAIEFARKNNLEQTKEISDEWNAMQTRNIEPGETPWECPNAYYYEKAPLLTTAWEQGMGYNDLCPFQGCSVPANGHALTGCVATAMAQIMRYYEYPSNYNWSTMLNNSGTSETQALMRDAGTSVDMDYGCEASGASSSDVDDALLNDFSYSNASYSDFNHNTVKSNLQQNRPVYMSGDRISGYFLGIPLYTGHAWVCDGYRAGHECIFDDYGNVIGAYDYLYFHMNWGWGNNFSWCGLNNFTAPNGNTYNYHRNIVYNIEP